MKKFLFTLWFSVIFFILFNFVSSQCTWPEQKCIDNEKWQCNEMGEWEYFRTCPSGTVCTIQSPTSDYVVCESNRYLINEGESMIFNGKTISLSGVSDYDTVVVDVDGTAKVINKDEIKTFDGLSIKVVDVYYLPKEGEISSALLEISETSVTKTCEDSDGGINYFVKGCVTVCTSYNSTLGGGGGCSQACDYCTGNELTESYCENNERKTVKYVCPDGCVNGACQEKTTTTIITTIPCQPVGCNEVCYPYPGCGCIDPSHECMDIGETVLRCRNPICPDETDCVCDTTITSSTTTSTSIPTTIPCTATDPPECSSGSVEGYPCGYNPMVKGITRFPINIFDKDQNEDYCISNTLLNESYCEMPHLSSYHRIYDCTIELGPNGQCYDGACVLVDTTSTSTSTTTPPLNCDSQCKVQGYASGTCRAGCQSGEISIGKDGCSSGYTCCCSGECPGDINNDGIVDIYDAIILATAFGSSPGDPSWNPDADLTGDDHIIDIYDSILLAGVFGEVC